MTDIFARCFPGRFVMIFRGSSIFAQKIRSSEEDTSLICFVFTHGPVELWNLSKKHAWHHIKTEKYPRAEFASLS